MNTYYYDVKNDINEYNDCWCYIIVGGRNTGKTYSALKMCMLDNMPFVFVKRTIEDVDLICAGNKSKSYEVDLSPFKSINRDFNRNIKAFKIFKGLGAFYECDDDNQPIGLPLGYIVALTAVQKVKGFDLSECQYLIFDEFIPQPWERVNRREGEQVMDLYKTISRDREHRGQNALKLICIANATQISNPVMNTLEITDLMADMQANNKSVDYDQDRLILTRILLDNEEFKKKERESSIYRAMGNTAWGQMALESTFSYDDFTAVKRMRLKGYKGVTGLIFKNNYYYIYQKDGHYYMCRSRCQDIDIYDLNLENDQKKFYYDFAIDLRNECIEGNMDFQNYTMYDLIVNYKKFFKL